MSKDLDFVIEDGVLVKYSGIFDASVPGFTLGRAFSTTPFSSMAKAARTTPMLVFP